MSTAVVAALIDRYLWGLLLRHPTADRYSGAAARFTAAVIFLIALVLVLGIGYQAQTEFKGLLAGSGVAAIILGFGHAEPAEHADRGR